MESDDIKLICLTPAKNEAWIMRRQLACASTWADHIIVADQMSTDSTRRIAEEFPKVRIVRNEHADYHEGNYRRILAEAARTILGRRVLIAVDADEAVTANWMTSPEWQAVREAAPGTVIRFNWVNILPGSETCWVPPDRIAMGFVDDGVSQFSDGRFHVARLPVPSAAPELVLNDVKMLHFQYLDWNRMKSKQARYQCTERVTNRSKRAINLYRQYHNMDAIPPADIAPVRPEWIDGYERLGIDMRTVDSLDFYPTDLEVIDLMLRHGTAPFVKLDVWSTNWAEKAERLGLGLPPRRLFDPRSRLDKAIHRWLARTQGSKDRRGIRNIQRLLRLLGW